MPPCVQLHKNFLDTADFKEFAKKSLVLVELDFPLKKANQTLSEKYKIEGFPTLIVLNSDGKELWRQVGYGGDSAKAVVRPD